MGLPVVPCYEVTEVIGEGTYGVVYKATCRATSEVVAIKKIREEEEQKMTDMMAESGRAAKNEITSRQIKTLKSMRHRNIIELKDVVDGLYLVFEYAENELHELIGDMRDLSDVKWYAKQILEGLAYLHARRYVHRDITPPNLLVNGDGVLKIADFDLARKLPDAAAADIEIMTNPVVARWYRAPELLLGATLYGESVDVWSFGCVLAEMLMRKPLFPGSGEVDQLHMIFARCGTPKGDDWAWLPRWRAMRPRVPIENDLDVWMRDRGLVKSKEGRDLVARALVLDPAKRITAAEALRHAFFFTEPLGARPVMKPAKPKKRRRIVH